MIGLLDKSYLRGNSSFWRQSHCFSIFQPSMKYIVICHHSWLNIYKNFELNSIFKTMTKDKYKCIITCKSSFLFKICWNFSIKQYFIEKIYNPQWSLHLLEFLPTDLIQKLPYASEKYIVVLLFTFCFKMHSLELTENITYWTPTSNKKNLPVFHVAYTIYICYNMIHITHIEGTLFQKISGCIGKYVSKKNNQCSLSLKTKSCLISSFAVFITILWEFCIKVDSGKSKEK